MKTKISIAITLVLFLGFSTASAGSRGRDIARGVIIGTTAAVIGAAIINEMHDNRKSSFKHNREYRIIHKEKRDCREKKYKKRHHSRGYWAFKKVWVSPDYEKRWNPGHYNRRGRWVPGKYQRVIVREGYWKKNRVWVFD